MASVDPECQRESRRSRACLLRHFLARRRCLRARMRAWPSAEGNGEMTAVAGSMFGGVTGSLTEDADERSGMREEGVGDLGHWRDRVSMRVLASLAVWMSSVRSTSSILVVDVCCDAGSGLTRGGETDWCRLEDCGMNIGTVFLVYIWHFGISCICIYFCGGSYHAA